MISLAYPFPANPTQPTNLRTAILELGVLPTDTHIHARALRDLRSPLRVRAERVRGIDRYVMRSEGPYGVRVAFRCLVLPSGGHIGLRKIRLSSVVMILEFCIRVLRLRFQAIALTEVIRKEWARLVQIALITQKHRRRRHIG